MERDTSRVDLVCNRSKHNHEIISISVQYFLVYFCHTDNFRDEVGDPVPF